MAGIGTQEIILILGASGVTGGTVVGLMQIIFASQNRKIERLDRKSDHIKAELTASKVDKALCQMVHKNTETNTADIKKKLISLENLLAKCNNSVLELKGKYENS